MDVQRITGLASGMDTESMVKKLMDAQKAPLNRLFQQKQWIDWQRDAYRETNTTLLDFRKSMEKLRLQSTFQQTKSSSSNEDVVKVEKAGTPSLSNYTISDIVYAQPATAASVKFDSSTLANDDTAVGSAFSFDVNGTRIDVSATDTIKNVISKINAKSTTTGVVASYFSGDKTLNFTTKSTGSSANIAITNSQSNPLGILNGQVVGGTVPAEPARITGTTAATLGKDLSSLNVATSLSIVVDGTSYSVDAATLQSIPTTYTKNDLANILSNAVDSMGNTLSSVATVSVGTDGKLSVTGSTTGAGSSISYSIADGSTGADKTLLQTTFGLVSGISDSGADASGFGVDSNGQPRAIAGTDLVEGSVTINGTVHQTTSNTFAYDGLKMTLKQETLPGEVINIAVETDTEAIFNDIKTFVDEYNKVIEKLNAKIDEKKYRDFPPLLDDQKKDMKEKDVELWEEKAKSGLLNRDSIVTEALSKMRSALYTSMQGASDSHYDTLAEIGITTSDKYKENGKLVLDESKLKNLLESNLSDVQELFTKTYDTGDDTDTTATDTTKLKNSGIGWRIYDQINASIRSMTDKAGLAGSKSDDSLLGDKLNDIDDSIDRWQDKLTDIENRYWKQFGAMESALSKMNQQSAWLTQQLGGGSM